MIITEIQGNINDLPQAERDALVIDTIIFDNETRLKRIQRVTSKNGAEYALRLSNDLREIKDGDIFIKDNDTVLVAEIAATDVLVITPKDIREALAVAHTLGNRHLQAQFFDQDSVFGKAAMVVRFDHTVEHYLEHAGVEYTRGNHVMPEAFRHAEHSH
ncbi:urease accessory protein [Corynebacterium kutscheri]|uniref:Urease accessory protein UreE n=1 Tax=Corynebacterium kutscheri TaxID=35755 RepID=A0AB38VUN6_9CORY|nr:urease accessory protein UreE [Corynebacterium kutscheri]VEH05357.1 urease accessory protein [Corynebacterium kutscheri]VEH80764.1 urease accessory protein [Corynebacterium kutscheri]